MPRKLFQIPIARKAQDLIKKRSLQMDILSAIHSYAVNQRERAYIHPETFSKAHAI
jgi:hypothetical protein